MTQIAVPTQLPNLELIMIWPVELFLVTSIAPMKAMRKSQGTNCCRGFLQLIEIDIDPEQSIEVIYVQEYFMSTQIVLDANGDNRFRNTKEYGTNWRIWFNGNQPMIEPVKLEFRDLRHT